MLASKDLPAGVEGVSLAKRVKGSTDMQRVGDRKQWGRVVKDSDLLEDAGENTHNVVQEMVADEVAKGHILDIPCGEGAFSKRLAENGFEVDSADCVEIVKYDEAKFRIADMNRPLPYEDGVFDGVVCIDGIEHIEKPFDFIRECGRILKQGGFLIISTPNISALRSRWRYLLTGFHNKARVPLDETSPHPLHHITMVSLPELRYRLATNGFVVTQIRTNRVKSISWLYVFLVPFAFVRTLVVFAREAHNETLKEIFRQVFRWMFSVPVLFGETLIVKAKRK